MDRPRSCLSRFALLCFLAASLAQAAPPPEQITLDQRFEADVRQKVEEPNAAALRRLNESYRVSLDAAFKKASAQGQLDDAVAAQSESKRFAASGTVPAIDEPGAGAEVVKLRGFYRAEADRLAKARAAALVPIQQAYVASLRILEKEFTKTQKIDEAIAVRAQIEKYAIAPAPPAASTPVPAAVPAAAAPATSAAPFGAAVNRCDFYASGNNSSMIFVSGKEVMKGVNRDNFFKARVNLKEGDVIAIQQGGRFSDNFIWLSAISVNGDFLFETSLDWKCYLPKNPDKWWDTKNIKMEQPAEFIPEESQYRPLVTRAALATPLYRGTLPLHSALREPGAEHVPCFFYHVVTRQDLMPKKIPAAQVLTDAAIPWIGKTVRIKASKDGTRMLVLDKTEPKIGPPDPAAPANAMFRILRGPRPCTILLETLAKRGVNLRKDGQGLHLLDSAKGDPEFVLEKAVTGAEGYSIAAGQAQAFHIIANDPLLLSNKVRDDLAVFYLEEVKGR